MSSLMFPWCFPEVSLSFLAVIAIFVNGLWTDGPIYRVACTLVIPSRSCFSITFQPWSKDKPKVKPGRALFSAFGILNLSSDQSDRSDCTLFAALIGDEVLLNKVHTSVCPPPSWPSRQALGPASRAWGPASQAWDPASQAWGPASLAWGSASQPALRL